MNLSNFIPQSKDSPWADRANELARWTLHRLANRLDVWGCYLHPAQREEGKAFGRTAPRKTERGRVFLTLDVLRRHFAGRSAGHIIGLHSTSTENTSRWGALDIDKHDGGTADPQVNLAAALGWYVRLRDLGFQPLLTDSNGKGGFHLLVVFAEPVATERVFAFLRWLVQDYRQYGLTAAPEQFPKQPGIEPGKFGNWLRLPGRHHTKNHWSRVWDGAHWLDGAAAVELILSLEGDSSHLIPAEAIEFFRPPLPEKCTKTKRVFRMQAGGLAARIRAYLAKLPHLSAGQGRDDIGFNFASFLVRDLNLTDGAALAWLNEWDTGNHPPKGGDRLKEILANAHLYGQHAYGSGLGEQHEVRTIRTVERID